MVGLGRPLLLVFLAVFVPVNSALVEVRSDASRGGTPAKWSEYGRAATQRSSCFALFPVCCFLVRLPERTLFQGNLLAVYERYHLLHIGWQALVRERLLVSAGGEGLGQHAIQDVYSSPFLIL